MVRKTTQGGHFTEEEGEGGKEEGSRREKDRRRRNPQISFLFLLKKELQ